LSILSGLSGFSASTDIAITSPICGGRYAACLNIHAPLPTRVTLTLELRAARLSRTLATVEVASESTT
jgi:hypothetical protein